MNAMIQQTKKYVIQILHCNNATLVQCIGQMPQRFFVCDRGYFMQRAFILRSVDSIVSNKVFQNETSKFISKSYCISDRVTDSANVHRVRTGQYSYSSPPLPIKKKTLSSRSNQKRASLAMWKDLYLRWVSSKQTACKRLR